MKRIVYLIIVALLPCSICGQRIAIKENLPLGVLRVPNLSFEIGVAPNLTLDVSGAYNPFQESTIKKWKLWSIQPELRYWFVENFAGSFVGLHAGVGQYNIGGFNGSIDLGGLGSVGIKGIETTRVQGPFWDAGISYGYHRILSPHWGIETTIGLGFGMYHYDRFRCLVCGEKQDSGTEKYYGPTRAAISLIYMIR